MAIDRLNKYGHLILIKLCYSGRSIAEVLTREVVRLHRVPVSIVSDRDPTCLSHYGKNFSNCRGQNSR